MKYPVVALLLAMGCGGAHAPPPRAEPAQPPPPDAQQKLAECIEQRDAGALDAARTACELAREHGSQTGQEAATIHIELARVAFLQKLDDEGLRLLARAIELHETTLPHFLTGEKLLERFLFKSACDSFKRVVALDKGHARAQAQLAACVMADGEPRAAKEEYELCRRVATSPCTCEAPVAAAAIQSDLLDGALRYADTMVEECPDDPRGHTLRCQAHSKAGNCKEAKRSCAEALRLGAGEAGAAAEALRAERCAR